MFKRIFSALLALCLCSAPAALAVEGMDVSVFQGAIDFGAAKADGIEAVYIRSSYGLTGQDARFRDNYAGAKAAGIPLGFYHYLNAETPERAVAEADRFADLIEGLDYQLRPVLDYEVGARLTPAQATAVARAFLERVEERTGAKPMIYAAASYARRLSLAEYPLWVAQWGVSRPQIGETVWERWTGWQYTATGRVDGIQGPVDRDLFCQGAFLDGGGEEPDSFPYTVRRGDTLTGIARRFGTTVGELVRRNGIADPNRIYAGETLRIPGTAPETYRVVWGDTLTGIARRFGTTVGELVQLNGIADPNRIYAGETLRLR